MEMQNHGGRHPSPISNSLYRPIEPGQIRILEILPGCEDPIQCRLQYVELCKMPKYNALSYSWGDLSKPKSVVSVDGHKLEVTENCALALLELRREAGAMPKTQIIWIDAICINQEDTRERSQQVLVMFKIYQSSQSLIIWLGVEAEGSNEAIEILEEAAQCFHQGSTGLVEWCEHFIADPRCKERWRYVACFFSRPWFKRVWVIQEFLAAKAMMESMFYCGSKRVKASILASFVGNLSSDRTSLKSFQAMREKCPKDLGISFDRGAGCFASMFKSFEFGVLRRLERTINFPNRLLECVLLSCDREATNPRDKIYAHLGLVENETTTSVSTKIWKQFRNSLKATGKDIGGIPLSIPTVQAWDKPNLESGASYLIIDYEASIEDVYSSFVRLIVLTTKSLNILSLCWQRSVHITRTWTLDLTTLSFAQSSGILTASIISTERHRLFRASKDARPSAIFHSDLSVLTVRGLRVATVMKSNGSRRLFLDRTNFIHKICQRMVVGFLSKYYPTPEEVGKAIWKAWIHGTLTYKLEGDPEGYKRWLSWLENDKDDFLTHEEWFSTLWQDITGNQVDRDLFVTEKGHPGLGWKTVKDGDFVCIILGCDVPLVLRPVKDHYELIGDCYMDGFMEGEGMENLELGKGDLITFHLH